jgi:hypothetical protein
MWTSMKLTNSSAELHRNFWAGPRLGPAQHRGHDAGLDHELDGAAFARAQGGFQFLKERVHDTAR